MGGGVSTSYVKNVQNINASIVQQYSGSCDINCMNSITNLNIDILNSVVGDITVSQACTLDAVCILNNNMGAVIDSMLSSKNSSDAKNTASFFSINYNESDVYNEQDISSKIQQIISQKCQIESYNSMNNILLFADNSSINNIMFSQKGNVVGSCTLKNMITANAYASGTSQNDSTSGKEKKKSKQNKYTYLLYIGIGLIVSAVILGIIGLLMKKSVSSHTTAINSNKDDILSSLSRPTSNIVNPSTDTPSNIVNPSTDIPKYTTSFSTTAPQSTDYYQIGKQNINPSNSNIVQNVISHLTKGNKDTITNISENLKPLIQQGKDIHRSLFTDDGNGKSNIFTSIEKKLQPLLNNPKIKESISKIKSGIKPFIKGGGNFNKQGLLKAVESDIIPTAEEGAILAV